MAFVVDYSKLKKNQYQDWIRYSHGKKLHEAFCCMVPREFVSGVLDKVSDRHRGTPYPPGILALGDPDQYIWSIAISGNYIQYVYDHPDRIDTFVGLPVRYSRSTIKRQVISQGGRLNGVRYGNSRIAGVIDSKDQVPITVHELNGGAKRRRIYHPNGGIAATVIAEVPTRDCALALLDTAIGHILHVRATEQSNSHDAAVRSVAIDGNQIEADIAPPGTSESGVVEPHIPNLTARILLEYMAKAIQRALQPIQ